MCHLFIHQLATASHCIDANAFMLPSQHSVEVICMTLPKKGLIYAVVYPFSSTIPLKWNIAELGPVRFAGFWCRPLFCSAIHHHITASCGMCLRDLWWMGGCEKRSDKSWSAGIEEIGQRRYLNGVQYIRGDQVDLRNMINPSKCICNFNFELDTFQKN